MFSVAYKQPLPRFCSILFQFHTQGLPGVRRGSVAQSWGRERKIEVMPTLFVENGYQGELAALGRNRSFENLSQKRITKAAREALRRQYGTENVEVACAAFLSRGEWVGNCTIGGRRLGYRISCH